METSSTYTPGLGVTLTETEQQLVLREMGVILASRSFWRCPRHASLLSFIVHLTLAGREGEISEYSIAQDVYGRTAHFDPKLDSTVRVGARRLRERLEKFYLDENLDRSAIRITLPAGRYVPVFVWTPENPVESDPNLDAPREIGELIDELQEEERPCLPPRPVKIEQPGSAAPPNNLPRLYTTKSFQQLKIAYFVSFCIVLLAIIGAYFIFSRTRLWFLGRDHPQIQSIAVLPMEDLAPDSKEHYLVDGMTDDLIVNLAQRTPLRVISRTSVMEFKDRKKSLREIARALHVDAVVESSFLQSGQDIRITAQLVDPYRDQYLWAQSYTRGQENILLMQDEIASDIALQVNATVNRQGNVHGPTRHPTNLDAYKSYLRGRYFWEQRTPQSLQNALHFFQSARDIDPNYAMAYVGLADTYMVISYYGGGLAPSEAFPKAEEAARQALKIDPDLGEAHTALGRVFFSYYWDWSHARREFQRAIELNPSDATAHHWYGEQLAILGKPDEALAEICRAEQIDPLAVAIQDSIGGTLYHARRYDRALSQVRKMVTEFPEYPNGHQILGSIYLKVGRSGEALAELQKAVSLSGKATRQLAALGWAAAETGNVHLGRAILADLVTNQAHQYISPVDLAALYTALGETNPALQSLEKAYRVHTDTLPIIGVDPAFDRLRHDRQFQNLLARMHLPN